MEVTDSLNKRMGRLELLLAKYRKKALPTENKLLNKLLKRLLKNED